MFYYKRNACILTDSLLSDTREKMLWTLLVLEQLCALALSSHCPSECVCDIRGSAKCSGDITDIPNLDPGATYLLSLNGTHIGLLQEQSFQPFHLLLRVMLTHSSLHTIHPSAFRGSSQLRSVKLSSNALSALPPRVFIHLRDLEQLQLDDNHLVSLSAQLFAGLTNLTELDISKNRISHLDANVFQNLTGLTFLNLAGNHLSNLPQTLFHNLRRLKSLVLSSNRLTTVGKGQFDHLTNLLVIMLQKNQISHIPPGLFWNMPSLLTLSLSSNHLQHIPAQSFYYLPNLTKLTLYKNPLIDLPDLLMGRMPRLQELYLYETNLTTVPRNLFVNTTNLKWLHLHFNDKLASLPKDLFCCLPDLVKLSLKNNKVQKLHPDLFRNLTRLKTLMLNDNEFETLPESIFQHTTSLEVLYLNQNRLRVLHAEVFTHARALKTLTLSGNKWYCNCSIFGIANWISENSNLIVDLDRVRCDGPQRLKHQALQMLTDERLQCGLESFETTFVTRSDTEIIMSTMERENTDFTATASPVTVTEDHTLEEEHKNNPVFYNTVVLDQGTNIVHNNKHNGWVYLWTVPSSGLHSGLMMALFVVLLVTGAMLIIASMCVLYRLHKMKWLFGFTVSQDLGRKIQNENLLQNFKF